MKSFQSSRVLNETGGTALGLGLTDYFGLMAVYGFLQGIWFLVFRTTNILLLVVMLLSGIFLIYIRQKYRKHIIRDYIKYKFTTVFKFGVWNG